MSKEKEIQQRIVANNSRKFCSEFINHIPSKDARNLWESRMKLAVAERTGWTTFIMQVGDVRILFYHNKFVKDKSMTYIIKVAFRTIDIRESGNIIPNDLSSKEFLLDEDYEVLVNMVLNYVDHVQSEFNRTVRRNYV